jgi:zinc D-Ala-D-Ala carboxypeptidase
MFKIPRTKITVSRLLMDYLRPRIGGDSPRKPEAHKMTAASTHNLNTHLSANFTIREFEASQTASRHNISNQMSADQIARARVLAQHVLQPIRDHFGVTVITSGFRGEELNRRIGGARNSQHMTGEAADIRVPGVSNYELAVWIRDNLEYDQLILEAYTPGDIGSGWVHVSFTVSRANRKENLTATFINGRAHYSVGLVK